MVDSDVVEASNLHRQVLHQEASCGLPKAVSACREGGCACSRRPSTSC
ncbi:MAG: ThiF family adenylyltransferase [Allorhizobium sp.]